MDQLELSATAFIFIGFILPMLVKKPNIWFWLAGVLFVANFFQFGYYSDIVVFTYFGIGLVVSAIVISIIAAIQAVLKVREME